MKILKLIGQVLVALAIAIVMLFMVSIVIAFITSLVTLIIHLGIYMYINIKLSLIFVLVMSSLSFVVKMLNNVNNNDNQWQTKSVFITRFFYFPRGIILYPKQWYWLSTTLYVNFPLCWVFRLWCNLQPKRQHKSHQVQV